MEDNPIQALAAEGRKAHALPIKIGALSVKRANQWVEESLTRPDPRFFCGGLIVENENIVLFAVSNAGKSIFATQLAEEIAAEEPVLYIDCELSDKQFQLRYTDTELGIRHVFPENFLRAEIDPEDIDGSDMDKAILSSVEEAAKFSIRKIFIDNITFIARDSEKASAASEFMKRLVKLKKTLGLTIIVLAHTPKVHGYQVMSQYSLAGSAQLINFFDSAIAIGLSAENKNYRYVKQVNTAQSRSTTTPLTSMSTKSSRKTAAPSSTSSSPEPKPSRLVRPSATPWKTLKTSNRLPTSTQKARPFAPSQRS